MDSNSKTIDVLVIGGGPAGMMAAGVAGQRGKNVLVLEKNDSLGEKLKITGGGRCNITNAEYDIRAFIKNYGKSAEFLYSPFAKFGVANTFEFFESRGLPLVVQARNRAFPHTEKANDVFKLLKKNLQMNRVEVRLGCFVKRIAQRNGQITHVETNLGNISARSYILATGGVSHPETGSTGDGFQWLHDVGHSVAAPTPTIVPLAVQEEWVKSLAGVSLSFMKISFFLDGKKHFHKVGKVLFTHFGLSGPLILNSASSVGEMLLNGLVSAQIDLFPDTDLGDLDNRLVNAFNLKKNNELKTVFRDFVPKSMAKSLESIFPDINFATKVHSITKEQRSQIVHTLKALPLTITGLMGNDRAVAADGGVTLSEIDTRTMRSKLFSNLYIIGDLLHINRPSGGYSLQLCWTTGYVAGSSV